MAAWADLRYSARSLARTPGLTLTLLLTIALGIGSNAAVVGFIRGLVTRDLPLPGLETVVSVFAQGRAGRARPGLVRGLPVAQGSARGVRVARRRPRVAGQRRDRRPLVGHVRRRGHARVGRSPAAVARRRRRHQSSRVAERVRRQGRRSRRADPRGRRRDARGRRGAGVARRPVSRPRRRRLGAVAGSVASGDRSQQPDFLGARAAARRRVSRSSAGRGERDAERRRHDRRAALHGPDAGGRRAACRASARCCPRRPARCSSSRAPTSPRSCCRARPPARTRRPSASRSAPAAASSRDSCSRTASSFRWPAARSACCSPCGRRRSFRRSFSTRTPNSSCSRRISSASSSRRPRARHHDRLRAPAALRDSTRRPGGGASTRERRAVEGDAPRARRPGRGADGVLLPARHLHGPPPHGLSRGAARRAPATGSASRSSRRWRRGPASTRPDLGLQYFQRRRAGGAVAAGHLRDRLGRHAAGQPAVWQSMRVEPPQLPLRDVVMDVAAFTPRSLDARHGAAGRRADVRRRRHGRRPAASSIVNEEAASEFFDGDAVGRSIEDPAGQRVEIVGVVATRADRDDAGARSPDDLLLRGADRHAAGPGGPARFRVPVRSEAATACSTRTSCRRATSPRWA